MLKKLRKIRSGKPLTLVRVGVYFALVIDWFILSYDSANKSHRAKKETIVSEYKSRPKWIDDGKITDQFKQSATVSHKIGERPWRSSCQPTPFITFWTVLKNNSWKSN